MPSLLHVLLFHVLLQLTLPPERAWTKATRKRFLTSVLAHVKFQVVLLCECGRAYAALERLLSSVNPLVHNNVKGATAGIRAEVALVNLFPLILYGARLPSSGCTVDSPVASIICP